jgi:sulfite reductase (NADPH) flavoprotein alpha-component
MTPTDNQNIYYNPRISASNLVEFIASREEYSSTVYIFDLAHQAGFGALTKEWSKSLPGTVPVLELQTRAGAGLSLVGRLSEGTSQDTVSGAVLTAYTTPTGLSVMAPSLLHLPIATPSSRLVIQVPTIVNVGNAFSLSPSLAPLASVWSMLPKDIVVLLSATPQQTADFAALSYKLIHTHVIHLFDHQSSSREIGHSIAPLHDKDVEGGTVAEIIHQAGHKFFDYVGDRKAHTVAVVLNGPLALYAIALVSRTPGVGIVVVNVLRPWDDTAFRNILPTSVTKVHVIDDVPSATTQGALYIDVFGTLLESRADLSVHSHRISPTQTQQYMNQGGSFLQFLKGIIPSLDTNSQLQPTSVKRLLLFSKPHSSLSLLSGLVQDLFLYNQGVSARTLSDHDAFSKPGGIAATRMLLSPRDVASDYIPIPLALPWYPAGDEGVDFICVLDQSLLESHSIITCARQGSSVLVVTAWSSEELWSKLVPDMMSQIVKKRLRIFTINVKDIVSKHLVDLGPADVIEPLLAYLAFVRLYLGAAATESTVLQVARASLDESAETIPILKINSHTWSALEEIILKGVPDETRKSDSPLKEFVPNAIAVDVDMGQTPVNGAQLASWHDGAKHILFPTIFTPFVELPSEEFPQIPALRPEVPDRTYLVTCSVNRRLTPLEYDRNVFHLEFDTTGTGLTYAIGEALGVHGWNDGQEILDFCQWYGADPNRLITIPVAGGEGKMHTRTVFQALQQQIDLFGHPPKSFYTDLAAYASSSVDRHALLFIGSPEGSSTYKKLSDKDTVTYADILSKYTSARPGIERLCELVGDIKPRHYSIASAQSVVGNRVDLLVVTVEWATPSGRCDIAYLFFTSLTQVFRFSSIWPMYQVSCRPKSWAKGDSIHQTQCDEGMFLQMIINGLL